MQVIIFIGYALKLVQRFALMCPFFVPSFRHFIVIFLSMQEKEEKNDETLGDCFSKKWLERLFQIWYADSPTWWASLQQIWLNLGKRSRNYIGVKITFLFFPVNILAHQLLGQHNTLPCVLIRSSQNHYHIHETNETSYPSSAVQ